MKYLFDVTLVGEGSTKEEAWVNALRKFISNPGQPEKVDELGE